MGVALLTAEAVLGDRDGHLPALLASQPPWSDLPLIVLVPAGADSPRLVAALQAVGPMTLMNRPVQVAALVSAVQAAIRDRRRQYAIRDYLAERQRAEEAVRRSEERYRRLFEQSPLAIQVLAPDGRALRVNQAWEELWGAKTVEDLREYNVWHDPQLEALGLTPLIERAFAGEPVELPPVTYVPSRGQFVGQPRSVRAVMYPIKKDHGIEEVVLIQQDITNQQQAEEALREAHRRKDEFMAMLAHELRNPLAPLRNSLQILQLRAGEPKVFDKVQAMMERQLGHLSRLVDDLLDVSRITMGKVRLRTERLDLVRIVRQETTDHRLAFDAKGVALVFTAPDQPVWVSGDATRLAQVVDNLLTNALKFTARDGQVAVSIAVDGMGRALLTVRDTGTGIEPEMLQRLFEPFFQADRTLDRSQGGLGLGLAIVRGLAELHGGAVQAESPGLGMGAAFTVTLPAISEVITPLQRPPVLRPKGKGLRVLVVEDNGDAAESLRVLLETYGYQVTVVHSGSDGVRVAAEHRPDVVVCDIGLPGMDGYRVARALRDNPATAAVRLIALTGYGRDEDLSRAKEAGFDEYLTKPADPATLEAIIAGAA